MKYLPKINRRGDTVVEVMIAAALVIAALAVGYALSRQALRQTTDDGLRNQAIAHGQSQIEFIRNAATNYNSSTNTLLDTYKSSFHGKGFCILYTGVAQDANPTYDSHQDCLKYTGVDPTTSSPFTVNDSYDQSGKIFTITVQWVPLSVTRASTVPQQLNFYYRSPF